MPDDPGRRSRARGSVMIAADDVGFGGRVAAGIVAVLLVATIAGRLLKARIADGQPHAVIDNANARIAAWWIIAAVFGMAAMQGAVGLALLFAAASLQALREFMPSAGPRPALAGVALVVLTIAQYLLAVIGPPTGFILLAPVAASMMMLAAQARAAADAWSWQTAAAAALLCIYGLAHVPALAALDGPNAAGVVAGPAIFLVIVVQAGDVMQYVAGKLAGRRPLAPRLSPGKTIEGALGGVAGAGLLGALLAPLTPYGPAAAAGAACLLTVLGIAGGLVLSAQKRRRGIKDWGRFIPGHGGVLDRLDSLCLSAPLFYHLLRIDAGT